MESSQKPPTHDEAAAALTQAEATRARFAGDILLPPWFAASIGAAISVQIATTALGLGNRTPWLIATGVLVFAIVGVLQLLWFRRLNGVWLGGLAGRVVARKRHRHIVVVRRRARGRDLGCVRSTMVADGAFGWRWLRAGW
jgi:hypothetical protein